MESICKLILIFHKVLVESSWAFLPKLTQYGNLMEAYFDIQYVHDGKLGGFVYDFIPYVNHMEAEFSFPEGPNRMLKVLPASAPPNHLKSLSEKVTKSSHFSLKFFKRLTLSR